MKKLLSLFAFSFLALAIALPSSVFAATPHSWVESQPNGDVDRVWTTGSSDADGSFLIVGTLPLGSGNGRMYTSDDGGLSWMERQPAGDISKFWRTSDINSDGSLLIIGSTERLYTSTDGGENWTERQPGGDANIQWDSVASDADGSNLIVGSGGERLYTSVDSGANWTERQPAGDISGFWVVDSDADGSALIAGNEGGRLYTSTNGGVNWTERQPAGNANKNWNSVASDSDGLNLIVAASEGRLYTSTNGGVNWTERQPDGDADHSWYFVSSDATGQNLFAQKGGQIYSSDDSGVTWVEEQPAGNVAQSWNFIVSDSDGTNVIAGASNDRIYTAPDAFGPLVTTFSPTNNETEVATDATFGVTFDEDIATSTGDITLHLVSDDSLVETIDITGPKVTLSDTDTLTIDPTVTLDLATEYYFLIGAGVVEDLFGNAFAGISDSTMWSFTADTLPAVSSFTPEDNATDVSLGVLPSEGVYIQFDQNVVVGTGNITLKKASDDSTALTFDVTDDNYVYTSGSDLYLYSEDSLEYATEYYLLIDATAIEDENGNAFAGISDPTAWSFTTRTSPLPATVLLDTTFVTGAGFDAFVDYLTLDADGKILVGGQFTSYNGDNVSRIARLNIDGSLDDTFVTGAGFDAIVYSLTLDADGKILVGGGFTAYDGGDAFLIARLNTDGSLDDTFVTGDGFNSDVRSIILDADGKILAGGGFSTYDGDSATSVARLNTDGSLDDTFVTGTGFDGMVNSLTLDADGKILAGGGFSTYDGDNISRIARLNTDGSLDDTFVTGDGFNGEVRTVTLDADGKILVGGDFSAYDGDNVSRIARLNTDGSLDDTFVTGTGFDAGVYSLILDADGKILVGGGFTAYDGGDAFSVIRLNTDGSLDDTFVTGTGFDDTAQALTLDADGNILVGGQFTLYDGDDVFNIARLIPPVDNEETPPVDEDDDSGSNSSHRRSGGTTTGGDSSLLTTLRSLIQQFIAQGGTPSPAMLAFLGTPSTTSSDYTRDLDIGDVGDDVRALQNFLIAQNKGPQAQALASNGATGYFGPLTQAALAEYQLSVGITPAVGFFGPVTRAFVNSL